MSGFLGFLNLFAVADGTGERASKPAELFNTTNVWTVHLKFSPDQWEAMEPKGGFNPFAMFGASGPGGPGGPGGFSLAMFLSPTFMTQSGRLKP